MTERSIVLKGFSLC